MMKDDANTFRPSLLSQRFFSLFAVAQSSTCSVQQGSFPQKLHRSDQR